MSSLKLSKHCVSFQRQILREYKSSSRVLKPLNTTRRYATETNTDRLKGPVPSPSIMQAAKNTIAENFGKYVPGAHSLAPEDSQFSLEQIPDLSGKVALITGGTEGIGYGSTHSLLTHNIKKLFVISQGPDIQKEAIEGISKDINPESAAKVEWIQCDLSDWEAVRRTADSIAKKTDRLDILINNAARGIMTHQLSKNGVDLHMAINHFGHVVLTAHLLPLLKKTASSLTGDEKVRIVNMSSNLHEQTPKETQFASLDEINKDYGPQPQYGRSKLAALLFAKYLARHVSSSHPAILSNATHPGIVETRQSTEHIHEAFPIAGYAMSVGLAPFKKNQFEGCVSSMYAATKTQKTGQYICPPAIVEEGSDKANDVELAETLMRTTWEIINEKCGDGGLGKGDPFKQG